MTILPVVVMEAMKLPHDPQLGEPCVPSRPDTAAVGGRRRSWSCALPVKAC